MESGRWTDYTSEMASNPERSTAPAHWLESLARSKAQIAAGETVPLLPVLDALRAAAERLEKPDDILPERVSRAARANRAWR